MQKGFVDLLLIVPRAIEQQASQHALSVEEVRMRRSHFAQLGLGQRRAARIDEDHGSLELENCVVWMAGDYLVDSGERLVVFTVFGGQLGQDEFVGIFGELLRHRHRADRQCSEQQQEPLLHSVHGITRFLGTPGRREAFWKAFHILLSDPC